MKIELSKYSIWRAKRIIRKTFKKEQTFYVLLNNGYYIGKENGKPFMQGGAYMNDYNKILFATTELEDIKLYKENNNE